MKYSSYPETILSNCYYFYRSSTTLDIIPCKAISELNGKYKLMTTRRDIFIAKKSEILKFEPGSRLFNHLMKQSKFRNCRDIMATVKAIRMDPNKVMVMDSFAVYDHDKDISDDEFFTLFLKFHKNDRNYSEICDILHRNVPGTASLTVPELYRTVCKYGGMNNVINLQIWKRLFYDQMPKTNVSFALRNFYKKYLYEFELYRREFEDSEFDFQYKFDKNQHVYFRGSADSEFCGVVIARRNRGLNIYYIRICNLKNECCDWFAEDIIRDVDYLRKGCINNQHTFTKYMKIYYFLPDPITQEKNAHNVALIRGERDKVFKKINESEFEIKKEERKAEFLHILADLSIVILDRLRKQHRVMKAKIKNEGENLRN